MDDATKALIGFNEAAFRKVNEALEAGRNRQSEQVVIRCECGSLGCNALLGVSVGAYEAVRSSPRRFLLVDGHETPETESVVERHDDFIVVEKHEEVSDIAEETDPRS